MNTIIITNNNNWEGVKSQLTDDELDELIQLVKEKIANKQNHALCNDIHIKCNKIKCRDCIFSCKVNIDNSLEKMLEGLSGQQSLPPEYCF